MDTKQKKMSEVSLFQGLICARVAEKKVSFLERCPEFRCVLVEGFHCCENDDTSVYICTCVNRIQICD